MYRGLYFISRCSAGVSLTGASIHKMFPLVSYSFIFLVSIVILPLVGAVSLVVGRLAIVLAKSCARVYIRMHVCGANTYTWEEGHESQPSIAKAHVRGQNPTLVSFLGWPRFGLKSCFSN